MLNAIETRTPPTIEDLAGISSDVSSLVEAIVAEVVEIDKALLALDELLNFLQPPRTGKIRIEWWERRGRRVPTPVIWSHSKAGWRAERVSGTGLSRRVKSSRDFHDNYPQVKAVCQNVTKLLTMREQALAPIAMLQRTAAGTLNSNGSRLTLACIGINLAMEFARRRFGVEKVLGSDNLENLSYE
ncbi:hypothetical protein [Burkholderia gladioli]|uniref:hypothetical protein n=1 Tax=Burkholderia gladioli TaxID=28095 RepID=UPI0016419009|nr:hypothetical protein [Burkholderia gladioli]